MIFETEVTRLENGIEVEKEVQVEVDEDGGVYLMRGLDGSDLTNSECDGIYEQACAIEEGDWMAAMEARGQDK